MRSSQVRLRHSPSDVKEHASGACYHDRGQEPASIYPDAHRLASFSDALVEQGEIAIELDGIEHRVRRGGLVVVPRGVAFRWRNASRERGVRNPNLESVV
jgi:hypothetical protein